MSKHLDELNDVIKQYEVDAHLGEFNKKLYALSSLIEMEAIEQNESPIPASYFEDTIVSEFLNRKDYDDFAGTGFIAFDRITAGFKNGEFLILAGLESMGKKVLMIEIANHWASKGKAVGFLNLAESSKSITKKFLANIGRLSPAFFNREWGNQESNVKLLNAVNIFKKRPIYIFENPNLHLNNIIIQIKKLVAERKVEIVFIDYLELIIVGEINNNLESKRTIICNQLKKIAIKLNIVLIVSSKLPRNAYTPTVINNTPVYCDLVSKGFIEPNTYTVIVHRLDYFGIEVDENNQSTKNRMELILAKYSTGMFIELAVQTAFDKTAIVDLDYNDI